jgi:hypothetical protein
MISMNRKLVAALGLGTALVFAMPMVAVNSIAATKGASTHSASTKSNSTKSTHSKKHRTCHSTATHKCPAPKKK